MDNAGSAKSRCHTTQKSLSFDSTTQGTQQGDARAAAEAPHDSLIEINKRRRTGQPFNSYKVFWIDKTLLYSSDPIPTL
jgi:hypothetical protein